MECNEHKTSFQNYFKTQGLKSTPARLMLLDIFAHLTKPISIQELKKKIGAKVDLVTLYRNAETLCKAGILNKIQLGESKDYYEFAKLAHHHHLVCTGCGKVSDVENCKVSPIHEQVLKKSGFAKITKHSLEFFGLCKQCA